MMTNPAQSQPSENQHNSSPKQSDGAQQQSPTNMQHSALAHQFLQNQLINQKQALGNANILGMPNFVNMSVESTNQQIQAQLLQSLMAQNFMQPSHFGQGSDEQQLYEYMQQLIDEKEKLKDLNSEPFNLALPMCAKLLDEEISRVRTSLFQLGAKEAVCLPEPVGPIIQFTEKLYVPVKDYPDFNFVGRILGPRGMTAKQLEQETGCKIMVRGKGSMRDKAKEEQMKGKPNWEHLNDELHVLVTCEDTKNRADIKLKRAGEEIKKLLVPSGAFLQNSHRFAAEQFCMKVYNAHAVFVKLKVLVSMYCSAIPEGEDELKKKQLMELAIINGTYRDSSKLHKGMNPILIPGGNVLAAAAAAVGAGNGMKSPPNPLGQSLILSPRFSSNGANQATQLTDPTTGLIYTTIPAIYSDQAALNSAQQSSILDYSNGLDFSQNAQRFSTINSAAIRAHPYARVALSTNMSPVQFESYTNTKRENFLNSNHKMATESTNTANEYLSQLLEDKKQLAAFPKMFKHVDRLLDEEIKKAQQILLQPNVLNSVNFLPEPVGPIVQITEKLYVPVKDYPDFNFVGRILGPRGMTSKQLEQETGCKIMVRGKGSMRDKAKEEQMKGKSNWEHLNDELHVLVTCDDTKNRAEIKIKHAVEEIKKLLVPSPEGEDELKKKQLMELAIINGTYKQKLSQILVPNDGTLAFLSALNPYQNQPLFVSQNLASSPLITGAPTTQIITPPPDPVFYALPTQFFQDPTSFSNSLVSAGSSASFLEYPSSIDVSQAGAIKSHRFSATTAARNHPYARERLFAKS
ncbi:held out wings isoform X3 [Brachionus plicatilis]|uniref:Held out wings isoform X3 n=1 Tax=Brachionus plicatilis TaxID=10195 RepID=A0A3M7T5H7_BRAPC|nr:held out wings isoform X3 [Brachionus plicatilis]